MKEKDLLSPGEKEVLIILRYTRHESGLICDASMAVSTGTNFVISRKFWDVGKVKLLDAIRCSQPLINRFLNRKDTQEALLKIR